MQRGVLHAAVVPVNRRPVFQCFRRGKRLVVVRVHIAQEVPGRTGPLRHGIGLALCRTAAARTGGVYPVGHVRQRRLAVVGRLVAGYVRQLKRQLILRQSHIAALVALDDRNRLAPVTLTGEYPVTQLVLHLAWPMPFSPSHSIIAGIASLTVLPFRKSEFTRMPVSSFAVNAAFWTSSPPETTSMISQPNFLANSQSRSSCAGTAMMAPGAVAHQNIVGNEDRDLLAVYRVNCGNAVQLNAGLVLVQLGTLEVGLAGSSSRYARTSSMLFSLSAHCSIIGCSGEITM